MNEPLISIIVPIYNVEKYIEKCLDSLIKQTYTNLEIILVDDGSPDNSGAICDKYASTDKRIKVIHQANAGVSAARNSGLEIVHGDYIVYMDPDDFVTEVHIENLYKTLTISDADISTSGFVYYKEGDSIPAGRAVTPEDITVCDATECLERSFYQEQMYTTIWGKMFKAELFSECRFPVGKKYEDIYVFYNTIPKAKKIAIANTEDYFYFIREGSATQAAFSPSDLDGVEQFDAVGVYIKAEFPELYHAFVVRRFLLIAFTVLRIRPGEFKEIRHGLWNRIKEDRRLIIRDKRVRKESKLIARVSYLGYRFTYWLYSLYKRM